MTLADAIQQAHEANSRKLPVHRPQQHIDTDATALLHTYARWCSERGLCALPCPPAVVAYWLQTEGKLWKHSRVELMLGAIQQAHFANGLANPIATPEVRFLLGELFPVELPRWKAEDKGFFASLPIDVQRAILAREKQRDRWLRDHMEELADLRKRQSVAAETTAKPNEESKNDSEKT
jgi:hypothetical protein